MPDAPQVPGTGGTHSPRVPIVVMIALLIIIAMGLAYVAGWFPKVEGNEPTPPPTNSTAITSGAAS